jgi:hypothetical protein
MKAEELGTRGPQFLSLRSLAVLLGKLLLKTPYKFKNSYGGTPEPQTAQNAPSLRGPSLKITKYKDSRIA